MTFLCSVTVPAAGAGAARCQRGRGRADRTQAQVSDESEDFVKLEIIRVSAALLGNNSATMDDIPFFSPAGVRWRAYQW
jgi:hypothetical protein